MEKEKITIEEVIEDFIKGYFAETKEFMKKYRINKVEAMLVLNRIELAKIHSHIDNVEKRSKK